MCVCWGVHMYTDSNSLDPSSRVIWGPFISCLPLFCACFFFLSLFFTILVLRLCVFGWSILVLRTLQEPEGFYVYIGLVWRLGKIRSSFSSSPSEKTIKKEDPKKKLKGKKKKKTSWLKEQLQTRGPTEQQSTHTGSRMARVFCWVS